MSALLRYRVKGWDNLRRIALRFLGDQERWQEIVRLNNLQPGPYGQYSLKDITWLTLPIPVGPAGFPSRDPYLTDLDTDNAGSLILTDAGHVGVRQGILNLYRAILRALSTPRGALIAHPEYGLDIARYVGHVGTPLFGRFLQIEVTSTILRDPRIAGVSDVTVMLLPDKRTIEIDGLITPVASDDRFYLRMPNGGAGVIVRF
jgi:phage baseplate assembly protein W